MTNTTLTLPLKSKTRALSSTIAIASQVDFRLQPVLATVYFLQSCQTDPFKYKLHCVTSLLKTPSFHDLKKTPILEMSLKGLT